MPQMEIRGVQQGQQTTGQKGAARSKAAQLVLSARDDAILRSVYTYHFLTAEQVTRLHYSHGSLKYVLVVLKGLADAGYLQRFSLPSASSGQKAYVYTLARKGIQYLQAAGYSEFARFRPSEHIEHSYLFLQHTLSVNDFLIAGALVQEEVGGVRLMQMQHERVLKQTPVKVTVRLPRADGSMKEQVMGIVPDGYLDFRIGQSEHMGIAMELDRGTVELRDFKRKIFGLIAYAHGPYQAFFNTDDNLTIAFCTTAGQHRAELMRSWTESVLTQLKAKQLGDIFLFTALDPARVTPQVLYLSPVWVTAFGKAPVSLLEL